MIDHQYDFTKDEYNLSGQYHCNDDSNNNLLQYNTIQYNTITLFSTW